MNNFIIPEWEKNTTGDTACEKLSKNATKSKKKLKPGKKARILEKLAKSAALANNTLASNGKGKKAKKNKPKATTNDFKNAAKQTKKNRQNFADGEANSRKILIDNQSNSSGKLPKKQKSIHNKFLTTKGNSINKITDVKKKPIEGKQENHNSKKNNSSDSSGNVKKKNRKKRAKSALNLEKQQKDVIDSKLKESEAKSNKTTSENISTNNSSNPKKKKPKKSGNSNEEAVKLAVNSPIVKRLQSPLKRAANAKLAEKLRGVLHREPRSQSLRQRMMEKLKGAHFRLLNEEMYTKEGKDAAELFKKDPTAFDAYHDGYRQQVARWPLNPLDNVIASIKKMSKNYVIADFGCGEGRLSKSVEQQVHSFDLVAANETVTACDMSHVPLQNNSVDVAVFCLSLMGTNLNDFLLEANRVLKTGGILKIAEVESRFDTVESFIQGVEHYGFKNTWKDFSHNLFYFLDFKKESNSKKKNKLPTISLHPCLYKKR